MDIETENGRERQNDLKTFSKDSSQSSDDLLHEGPSNNDVLGIAFYSFLGFTIVQTSFAIRAKSSAMMADSSAMFVDAGTYLCNMLAERLKSRALSKEEELLPQQVLQHKLKLQKLYLESFPPLFSVITLLYLTFATFQGSVITLFGPADTVVDDEEEPNLKLMMFFSFLNLLLDIVNVTCFARVNQAVMTPANFDTNTEKSPLIQNDGTSTTLETSLDDDEMLEDELINLNMCSAWTHVFADTIRSIAVLLAGALSYFTAIIPPIIADASAALVVSIVIFLTCIPLIKGLLKTFYEIKLMRKSPYMYGNENDATSDTPRSNVLFGIDE